MTYQSLNPATGKLLKKFDELTDKELETKIATAATCFETWRTKDLRRASGHRGQGRGAHACEGRRVRAHHDARDGQADQRSPRRGGVQLEHPRLLRQERRALPGAGEAPSEPRRRPYGEQPDRRDLLRGALELSLLPACPGRRSAFDGGQRRAGEARRHRAAMRDRLREALDRGGRARRPVYQSADLARSVGPRRR